MEDLRGSWEHLCILNEIITFSGTLLNINYVTLKLDFPKTYNLEDNDDVPQLLSNDTNDTLKTKNLTETILQLKYYL